MGRSPCRFVLEELLDEPVEGGVESPQIGRHDRHEDEGHGRGLNQGVAVRSLHALELGPAGEQKAEDGATSLLGLLGLALLKLLGALLATLLLLAVAALAPGLSGLC